MGKAFTKEKLLQMDAEHDTLLNTTKQMEKISELEMTAGANTNMNDKQMKKLRRQSVRQLKKQSTRQLRLSQSNLDEGIFSSKYVPIHSSEDMINSRLTVLTK